jgi:hypothetical protein
MGYACPVCSDPQADANHLANHLAFTALVRGGDHETWLDERVPEWVERGEDDLADVVVDYAEEEEFPQVFEDTTGAGEHDHDHERSGKLFEDDRRGGRQQPPGRQPAGSISGEETAAIVEEARELTERMLGDESDVGDDDGGKIDSGDDAPEGSGDASDDADGA